MKIRLPLKVTLWFVSIMMVAAGAAQENAEQPRNVELTNAAWSAYRKGDFATAITSSERCVRRFKDEANRDQEELQKKHAPAPPTGKVSAEQKKAIFDQGVLNDVATCYWIKGNSAQKLGRNDEAREAFKAAAKYSYARAWDPKGWFWSPADDAADRSEDIK
jgi:tetratricopeptide (TPR) repeat protein